MIIDSHCHLDYPVLYDHLDLVLKRAENNKVKKLLTICTTLESFDKIKIITEKYKNIYGTFGIHPHETKNHLNIDSNFIVYELTDDKSNKLKIFFDRNTLDLSGWRTVDAYSNEVIFLIRNIKSNVLIEKKIFKIPKEEDL